MCLPVTPFKIEREWMFAGLKCAVVMSREAGSRCGYVRVPPTHPLHGKHYDAIDVAVHGGLTFAEEEPCVEEDGKGWWIGFDCAHLGDAMYDPNPDWLTLSDSAKEVLTVMREAHKGSIAAMQAYIPGYARGGDHYWTQAEVESETEMLANQIAMLGSIG